MRKIKKDYLCIGLAVIISLGVAFGNYKIDKMIAEQEVKQEEVVEQKEQEVIEDKSLNKEIRNGEYQLEENSNSDVEIIESVAEKTFGASGFDYRVFKQDGMIILQVKLNENILMGGQYDMSSWNNLVDTMVELSGSADGLTSCKFVVTVTDYNEICYIAAVDGVLYIDVHNGINKLK